MNRFDEFFEKYSQELVYFSWVLFVIIPVSGIVVAVILTLVGNTNSAFSWIWASPINSLVYPTFWFGIACDRNINSTNQVRNGFLITSLVFLVVPIFSFLAAFGII